MNGGGRSLQRTGLWSKFPANREFTGNFCVIRSIQSVFEVFRISFRSKYSLLSGNSLLFKEQGNLVGEQGIILEKQGIRNAEQGSVIFQLSVQCMAKPPRARITDRSHHSTANPDKCQQH